jgi:Big-like domain-containing protein
MTLRKAARLLFVLSLMVSLGTCNQAIMVAPPGSTMELIANPEFIAAHGDVAVISAFVMDGTGQPVADGTVVQFFTNLGRIQEQGKTNDGVARVNLTSDSRSGEATVTAVSGGGAAPPVTTVAAAPPVVGFASAMSVTGASVASAAQLSAQVTVRIGSARPQFVVVSADPPRITTGRGTTILAQVFDEFGNPVANVPVIFTITSGAGLARLDSGGRPMFTDNDGRATDILRTNSVLQGTVTVRATTANNQSGEVTVAVN